MKKIVLTEEDFIAMALVPRYSGKLSERFWNTINKNGSPFAYSLGCALQNVEAILLASIRAAMLNEVSFDKAARIENLKRLANSLINDLLRYNFEEADIKEHGNEILQQLMFELADDNAKVLPV